MEQIPKEKLMRLSDVPKFIFNKSGISRCTSVVYGWANAGRKSYTGEHIVLKTTMRYGHKYTTEEWLMEFLEQLGS